MLLITVGLVIFVSLWREAEGERERAEQEAKRARLAEAEQSRERNKDLRFGAPPMCAK